MFQRLAEAFDVPAQLPSTYVINNVMSGTYQVPNVQTFSPIDELIAIKNQKVNVPVVNSLIEIEKKEVVENNEKDTTQPEYKKWFFDQQLAKKKMFMEKCESFQGYQDIDRNVFQGMEKENASVDLIGTLLHPKRELKETDENVKTTKEPKEVNDLMAERNENGILREVLLPSQKNTLTLALTDSKTSLHPILDLANSSSVKMYHHITNPPLRLDIFKQGTSSIHHMLQTDSNQSQSKLLPLNPSLDTTRDLYQPSGGNTTFNFCSDLPDHTLPPYNISCLQSLFRNMGGLPAGTSYPNEETILMYNNKPNLGAVKQYIHTLVKNKNSSDLRLQLESVLALFGITPDSLVKRAPLQHGVEVFWFVPIPGKSNQVSGFLKRTIEYDFIQFRTPNKFNVEQIGINSNFTMLQLTDIRTENDIELQFFVQTDDGFYLSVNQPVDADKQLFDSLQEDTKGLFGNFHRSNSSHTSQSCTKFRSTLPNIMKMYYEDSHGSSHFFKVQSKICNKDSSWSTNSKTFLPNCILSLTCERMAPFLCYEVDKPTMEFQELRNPILFGQFLGRTNLEYHTRTEESISVPGKKSFIRLNSSRSCIHLSNIAYQSWGTFTTAIRLQSMPIKETLLYFKTGEFFYSIIAKPDNGSTAKIHIEHNLGKKVVTKRVIQSIQTDYHMELNTWYFIMVQNLGNGFRFSCHPIRELRQNGGQVKSLLTEIDTFLYHQNMLWNSTHLSSACSILIGTNGNDSWPSIYSTVSCNYDIAWVHFFDYHISNKEIKREAKANWIYTAFPNAPYSYKVNLS